MKHLIAAVIGGLILTIFTTVIVGPVVADYSPQVHHGVASFYGAPDRMSAASRLYPPGTLVKVSRGNRFIYVVIVSQKGPSWHLFQTGRVIDLSREAFAELCNPKQGLCPVTVERIGP